MPTPDTGSLVCAHCTKRFTRDSSRGRLPRFCSEGCRTAARRARRRRVLIDTAEDDLAVRVAVESTAAQLGRVRRAARTWDARRSALAVLEQVAALQRELDVLTARAVQQARARQVGWDPIAQTMSTSPDTARTRWSPQRVQRITARHRANPPQRPRRTPAMQPAEPPASAVSAAAGTAQTDPAAQLSQALSYLHRASGKTARRLAEDTGVSPSYISRLLTGERAPSWDVTAKFARACDADPAQVRPLWDLSRGMHPARPFFASAPEAAASAEADFQAAVQALHLASSRPDPTAVARRTTRPLTPDQVTAVLEGDNTLPWPVVETYVHALQGLPDAIRPLWERVQVAHDPAWHPGSQPAAP